MMLRVSAFYCPVCGHPNTDYEVGFSQEGFTFTTRCHRCFQQIESYVQSPLFAPDGTC